MIDQPDQLIGKLIQRMGDHDPVIRRNAVGALRLHGTRAIAAVPTLSELVNDDDWRVRAEARRTLSQLRNAAA